MLKSKNRLENYNYIQRFICIITMQASTDSVDCKLYKRLLKERGSKFNLEIYFNNFLPRKYKTAYCDSVMQATAGL